jgi:hypothetical protein
MIKKDDSVRSLGQASIGTDKPTREALKAAARRDGITVSELMRRVALELNKDELGILPGLEGYMPNTQLNRIEANTSFMRDVFEAISDDAIIGTTKDAARYLVDKASQLKLFNANKKAEDAV